MLSTNDVSNASSGADSTIKTAVIIDSIGDPGLEKVSWPRYVRTHVWWSFKRLTHTMLFVPLLMMTVVSAYLMMRRFVMRDDATEEEISAMTISIFGSREVVTRAVQCIYDFFNLRGRDVAVAGTSGAQSYLPMHFWLRIWCSLEELAVLMFIMALRSMTRPRRVCINGVIYDEAYVTSKRKLPTPDDKRGSVVVHTTGGVQVCVMQFVRYGRDMSTYGFITCAHAVKVLTEMEGEEIEISSHQASMRVRLTDDIIKHRVSDNVEYDVALVIFPNKVLSQMTSHLGIRSHVFGRIARYSYQRYAQVQWNPATRKFDSYQVQFTEYDRRSHLFAQDTLNTRTGDSGSGVWVKVNQQVMLAALHRGVVRGEDGKLKNVVVNLLPLFLAQKLPSPRGVLGESIDMEKDRDWELDERYDDDDGDEYYLEEDHITLFDKGNRYAVWRGNRADRAVQGQLEMERDPRYRGMFSRGDVGGMRARDEASTPYVCAEYKVEDHPLTKGVPYRGEFFRAYADKNRVELEAIYKPMRLKKTEAAPIVPVEEVGDLDDQSKATYAKYVRPDTSGARAAVSFQGHRKLETICEEPDETEIQDAVERLIKLCNRVPVVNAQKWNTIPDSEAIKECVGLLNPDGASGYPASKFGATKKQLIENPEGLKYLIEAASHRRRLLCDTPYDDLLSLLKTHGQKGLIAAGYMDPVEVFVKNEPLAKRKHENSIDRLICCLSAVDQLVELSFNPVITKWEIENHQHLPMKPGIGMEDVDAYALSNYLYKRDMRKFFSTDCEGWDWSVQHWLNRAVAKFDTQYYAMEGRVANGYRNWYEIAKSYVVFYVNGAFLTARYPGKTLSGAVRTSSENSKKRALIALVAGAADVVTNGDDALDRIDSLDFEEYAARMRRLGAKLKVESALESTPDCFWLNSRCVRPGKFIVEDLGRTVFKLFNTFRPDEESKAQALGQFCRETRHFKDQAVIASIVASYRKRFKLSAVMDESSPSLAVRFEQKDADPADAKHSAVGPISGGAEVKRRKRRKLPKEGVQVRGVIEQHAFRRPEPGTAGKTVSLLALSDPVEARFYYVFRKFRENAQDNATVEASVDALTSGNAELVVGQFKYASSDGNTVGLLVNGHVGSVAGWRAVAPPRASFAYGADYNQAQFDASQINVCLRHHHRANDVLTRIRQVTGNSQWPGVPDPVASLSEEKA